MNITDYIHTNKSTVYDEITYASYLDSNLSEIYNENLLNENYYYGLSQDDLIEVTLFNTQKLKINFDRIYPDISYSILKGDYIDINNKKETYTVSKPFANIAKFNNNILLNTQEHILKLRNNTDENSFYILYNFLRNVAGDYNHKLLIKEISPSRTELRLSFAYDINSNKDNILHTDKISAFANKKYMFLNHYDLILNIIYNTPINQLFVDNEPNFNYIEISQLLGLKDSGELLNFINNIYTGYDFVKNVPLNPLETISVKQQLESSILIGIAKQLENFCNTYNSVEFSSEEILYSFKLIITQITQTEVLKQTSLSDVSLNKVVDLFVNIIYNDWLEPQIKKILNAYNERFYFPYKNALNFDDGVLIKILNHTSYLNTSNNKYNLQIKLDQPLPTKYSLRSTCWVSNISIAPVYLKVNLFSPPVSKKIELKEVNFNIDVNASKPKLELFEDTINIEKEFSHQNTLNTLKEKLNDLYIDYTSFNNFILYSSAELRSKLAKNKIKDYYRLETEKKELKEIINNTQNESVSKQYENELYKRKKDQVELLKTFDTYESFLFFYVDQNEIDDYINNGIVYDKNNRDSLINQLPEFIKNNPESEEFLKFISMVGHFFDTIYLYIKKFPKTYSPYDPGYPRLFLDEFLNSQNWLSLNTYFENSNILKYLYNANINTGMSYYDYGKEILTRFVHNLPYIYKTTGTRESISLLKSIFGIPNELLEIREYGSSDVLDDCINFYDYDTFVYLTKYTGENEYVTFENIKTDSNYNNINSIEFSFKLNNNIIYSNDDIITLFKKTYINKDTHWEFHVIKDAGKNMGHVVFKLYTVDWTNQSSPKINKDNPIILKTNTIPVFNGDLFTVILTREKIHENISVNPGDIASDYFTQNITLYVHQYDGYLQNFACKTNKRIGHSYTKDFSFGSFCFGSFITNKENYKPFNGHLDKIKIYNVPLSYDDVIEHSYNINSISISDKENLYASLLYLWSFNTPIDIASHRSKTNNIDVSNCNDFYGSKNIHKFKAYNFKKVLKTIEHGFPICTVEHIPKFPYQFDLVKIKQALNANNFGPNYKNNVKITKITESVCSTFTPYDYSTQQDTISGRDSNLVGVYISPQVYLEKCIENFLGKEGISKYISNPIHLYNQKYDGLNEQLKHFSKINKKYILPNEYYLTYKLYIDFSIFDYIEKVLPNRVTYKKGLLIEPSQLERTKINVKKITNDLSFDSTYINDIDFNKDKNNTSLNLNIKPNITSVDTQTNITEQLDNINTGLNVPSNTSYKTDNNQINYSIQIIPDTVDERNFICIPESNNVFCNIDDESFKIYNTHKIIKKYAYTSLSDNNTPITFEHQTNKLTLVLADNETNPNIPESYVFKNFYDKYIPHRHMKNKLHVGSRSSYIANEINTNKTYQYIKGKNDNTQTINRDGIYNGSEPIISINGFLELNTMINETKQYGYVSQTTVTDEDGDQEYNKENIFVKVPLAASFENYEKIEEYIYNL